MLQALSFYLFSAVALSSALMVITARNPVHSVFFLILAFFSSAGLFVLLGAEFLAMLLVVVYVGAVAVLFLFVVMMLDIPVRGGQPWFLASLRGIAVSLGVFLSYLVIFMAATYLMLTALSFLFDWGLGMSVINATELTRGPLEAVMALRDPFILDKFHAWSDYFAALFIILVSIMAGRLLATTVMRRSFWKLAGDLLQQAPVGILVSFALLVELGLILSLSGMTPQESPEGLLPIGAEVVVPNTHAMGKVLYTGFLYIFQTAGFILLVAMIGAIVLTQRTRPDSKRQNISEQNNRRKEDVLKLVKVKPGEGVSRWT